MDDRSPAGTADDSGAPSPGDRSQNAADPHSRPDILRTLPGSDFGPLCKPITGTHRPRRPGRGKRLCGVAARLLRDRRPFEPTENFEHEKNMTKPATTTTCTPDTEALDIAQRFAVAMAGLRGEPIDTSHP